MLTIGDKFPAYVLPAVTEDALPPNGDFPTFNTGESNGKWRVYFFWPKDFTFICPTEIVGYDQLHSEFADRDAELVGLSTDSDFVHHAWRNAHEDLRGLKLPMVSDIKKELSEELGILEREAGVALRATFIVDPDGIIQHVTVNGLNVGRNPQETLRVLDALQMDELCPCNWSKGDEVLKVA